MHEVLRRVGRYEILGEVGRGGMATVYIARQVGLGRNVALKELSAFHAADPMAAERFVRESQVAASLAHPNIVTVHDFFQEQGTPYIAMEYLDRGSLRPYMKRLSVAQVAGVLEGVLAGLTHAEAAGVVHRDLKPENLLVASDGGVKVADFGIAKAQRAVGSGRALTATGSTVGTPSYMAPEQAMARDIGPWTDLYSVGVLAYEALGGQTPFPDEETPMAVLLHHINDPVPPLRSIDPRIDPALAEWVESLLVKDPAKRTRTAYHAWDVLEGIVIDVVGPRWRRNARLITKLETVETPQPLTPAPFESSVQTPTPTPPEVAREPDPDREPAEPDAPRTSGFVTFRGRRRASRQPVPDMGSERDGAEILTRVVGLHPDVVQPGPDVDPPKALQPLGGLVRGREVPRSFPAFERVRIGRLRPDQLRRTVELGHIPRPAALRHEPAAGLQRCQEPFEQPVVVLDPVEGGGREDRVDGPVELELATGRRRRPPRCRPAGGAPPRPSPASRRPRRPRLAAPAAPAPRSRAPYRSPRRAPARRRAGRAGRAPRGPSPPAARTCARTRRRSSHEAAYGCTLSHTLGRDEPLDLVGRAVDERVDLVGRLAPPAEHVGGDDLRIGAVGPADADAHALEVGRAEVAASAT